MIFAEFEREFRNIYGTNIGRPEEYLTVKSEVVNLINKYSKDKKGKNRTYAKQLKKIVENRDNSFSYNIKYAFLDCGNILTPFVKSSCKGEYDDIIFSISERMGEIRNAIAHSHIDFKLDAIHLSDIKIIEELTYIMRLKKLILTTNLVSVQLIVCLVQMLQFENK